VKSKSQTIEDSLTKAATSVSIPLQRTVEGGFGEIRPTGHAKENL
jgi:hypothetical protein